MESAGGTSELAKKAHNYFGLKYRKGRCPTSCGVYYKRGSEQNKDGTYISSNMQWAKFPTMEAGVQGYFDFINISNYSNLKGVTNPKTYLENIKKDGYATSLEYVDNLLSVINKYNLTKYDPQTEVTKPIGYTNSPLVNYTKLSSNKTAPRNHLIDTITIHHMAGNLSVEACGNAFATTSREASSNYGVGSDGRIGLYVEEKDRSWCSSNKTNDHRAITIEVANDGGANTDWHVSDKAMSALIDLVADICKRNNIKKLVWSDSKNNRVNHLNGCNMTVHRDFAATACPGRYLYEHQSYIAEQVNKKLRTGNQNNLSAQPSASKKELYRVRKSWANSASQIGAYSSLDNAKKECKKGYYVFDSNGKIVYPVQAADTSSAPTPSAKKYTYQGIDYSLVFNPTYYANKYSDLKKAFGTNTNDLFNHFCTYGMKEGRVACDSFDVKKYKEYYADLRAAFGNNLPAYYKHYVQFGHKEKRKCV